MVRRSKVVKGGCWERESWKKGSVDEEDMRVHASAGVVGARLSSSHQRWRSDSIARVHHPQRPIAWSSMTASFRQTIRESGGRKSAPPRVRLQR